MENYKELLTALYKEHAPEKIDQIDFYLERYKGKEKQFYITQKAKYANKKSVKDSKKILEEAMARIKKKGETTDIKVPANTEKKKTEEIEIPAKKKEEKAQLETEKIKETNKSKEEKIVPTPITIKEKNIDSELKKPIEGSKKEEVKTQEINPPIKKAETHKTVIEEKKVKQEPIPQIVDTTANIQTHQIQPNDTASEKPKKDNDDLKQDDWKLEREKLQQTKNSYQEKEEKKTPVFWYFGGAAVIILLVAIAVWFLHFRGLDNKKEEPINVQKVKVENKEVTTTNSKQLEAQEEKQIAKKEDSQKIPPAKKEQEKPKETTNKATEKLKKETAQTRATQERIYAKDINRPAIFVSCFATKTEKLAQTKTAILKQNGLDAHYYWIPDINPSGNKFFKVVAGPFSNVTEAYPSLTKAQERINFDSYILTIE